MSLRYELHQAFDELAPSPYGLSDRVLSNAMAEAAAKTRRTVPLRFRVPLSMVAVLLLIAVVVAALTGGALVREWGRFSNPVPAHHLNLDRVHQLEARALAQPLLKTNAGCGGPWDSTTGWYGAGPAYLYSLLDAGYVHPVRGNWGIYIGYHALTPVGMTGPVLIRARNLVTGDPVVFYGRYAFGPVVGTDVVSGSAVNQQTEIVLDTDAPPPYTSAGHVDWNFTLGARSESDAQLHEQQPVCIGWQIDGAGFSETLVTTL